VLVTLKPSNRDVFDRELSGLVSLGYVYLSDYLGAESIVLSDSGRQALTT
jgi:hypothetical protein